MIGPIFLLEFVLGALLVGLVGRGLYLWTSIIEQTTIREKNQAELEYRECLEKYATSPTELNKRSCFDKGDLYFRFQYPDYFNYPLLDHDSTIQFIDNKAIRKELVEKDIENKKLELLKRNNKKKYIIDQINKKAA